MKIIRKQVWQARIKVDELRGCHNLRRAACHPVNAKKFEIVEADTEEQIVCSRKLKVYRNEKEINGLQISVALVQINQNTMVCPMKGWKLEIYPGHAMLLNSNGVLPESYSQLEWPGEIFTS